MAHCIHTQQHIITHVISNIDLQTQRRSFSGTRPPERRLRCQKWKPWDALRTEYSWFVIEAARLLTCAQHHRVNLHVRLLETFESDSLLTFVLKKKSMLKQQRMRLFPWLCTWKNRKGQSAKGQRHRDFSESQGSHHDLHHDCPHGLPAEDLLVLPRRLFQNHWKLSKHKNLLLHACQGGSTHVLYT